MCAIAVQSREAIGLKSTSFSATSPHQSPSPIGLSVSRMRDTVCLCGKDRHNLSSLSTLAWRCKGVCYFLAALDRNLASAQIFTLGILYLSCCSCEDPLRFIGLFLTPLKEHRVPFIFICQHIINVQNIFECKTQKICDDDQDSLT